MTEKRKRMKDVSTSNVSHVSRKPLHCMQVTTLYAGHVVEVTFRSHYNAYDLFSFVHGFRPVFSSGDSNLYSRLLYERLGLIWLSLVHIKLDKPEVSLSNFLFLA